MTRSILRSFSKGASSDSLNIQRFLGRSMRRQSFLKAYLKNLGVEPLNYPLKTGLIAEIGSGHPIIALRADIDALPI